MEIRGVEAHMLGKVEALADDPSLAMFFFAFGPLPCDVCEELAAHVREAATTFVRERVVALQQISEGSSRVQ